MAFGQLKTTITPFGSSQGFQAGSQQRKCMVIIRLTLSSRIGGSLAKISDSGVSVIGKVTGTMTCACKPPARGDEEFGEGRGNCTEDKHGQGTVGPYTFTIRVPAANGQCVPDPDCTGMKVIPETNLTKIISGDRLGESTPDGDGPITGDLNMDGCLQKPDQGLNTQAELNCMLARGLNYGATGKECNSASRVVKDAGIFVALKDFAQGLGSMNCSQQASV